MDVKLLQQTRGRTRVYKFPAAVTSSARRFRQGGFVRQLLRNGWPMGQYLWGVSPQRLAAHYERTRRKSTQINRILLAKKVVDDRLLLMLYFSR